jgi:hypothetical protein
MGPVEPERPLVYRFSDAGMTQGAPRAQDAGVRKADPAIRYQDARRFHDDAGATYYAEIFTSRRTERDRVLRSHGAKMCAAGFERAMRIDILRDEQRRHCRREHATASTTRASLLLT